MTKQEKATQYHQNKFNCSQSVFTVFGTEYGLSEIDCLKISCAFGGGMGRKQHVCGAVTGALMALGLKYGMARSDEESKKKETYAKTVEFFDKFTALNGSINCRQLLDGLDMTNPDEYKIIEEKGLFHTKCNKYIVDAVGIVEEMIK